jgi:hypothetical protein
MGQNAQGFAFPMFFLQAGQKFLALGGGTPEESRRFGTGPREMRVADFFP